MIDCFYILYEDMFICSYIHNIFIFGCLSWAMLCPCGQLTAIAGECDPRRNYALSILYRSLCYSVMTAVAGGCDPRRNFYKFSSVFLTKVSSKPFRAQNCVLLLMGYTLPCGSACQRGVKALPLQSARNCVP